MVLSVLDKALLGAAFAQILLALGLVIRMGLLRVKAVTSRAVRLSDVALSSDKYPEQARKASNAFDNQFQLPVLFLFAVLLVVAVAKANWLDVSLAWGFVALRYVHAFIHTTYNNLNHRFAVYILGMLVLSILLLEIFFRLFFPGAS